VNESAGQKLWKDGRKAPLETAGAISTFPLLQQNAKTDGASLRGLIGSSRNIDRHQSEMLIGFIRIPTYQCQRKHRPSQH